MLYLRDFVGTERYKKSIYFLYKDAQGEPIVHNVDVIAQICPILLWEDQSDGGVVIKFALYNEIPKGYKLWKDAPKAPLSYEWIHAKETAETERRIGLLKIKNKDGGLKNMKRNPKTIKEMQDTRVKTTFKAEITLDLPYLDNHSYVNTRLREAVEEILARINKEDTDGHFEQEDNYQMDHKTEVFYGYEEEEEYNIHDWDI